MTELKDIALTNDQYTCLDSIPGGAQAIVYKVRRHSDQKILALKVARIWNKEKPDTLLENSLIRYNFKRIEQEIAFLSQLEAPGKNHIVNILDQGTVEVDEHQCPAFVMPWYQQTLSKALMTAPKPDINQRLDWIRQMTMALQHIHHHSTNNEALVHRDFKLDNLMLDDNDAIRLLDFGISKSIVRTTTPSATRINYSPDCVAPEQVLLAVPNTDGIKRTALGPHTDIYALGMVIYYLITNQYPSAQTAFVDEINTIKEKHKRLLNADGKGLLGTIGGMNDDDYEVLKDKFISIISPNPEMTDPALSNSVLPEDTGTIISYDETIIDYDDTEEETVSETRVSTHETDTEILQLADAFTRFVKEMTHPELNFRPDATSAFYWMKHIQSELKKLQKTDTAVPTESQLPDTETMANHGAHQAGGSSGQPAQTLSLSNHENNQLPSLSDSKNEEGEKNESHIKKPKKPFKTIALIAASLATVLLTAYMVVVPGPGPGPGPLPPPKPVPLSNIPAELFDPSEDTRQQAWRDLFDRSQHDEQARQQLTNYETQISNWINSDNEESWKKAIPGLELAIRGGDENAGLWLAYAYQEGRGVDVNWESAWKQYQRMIEANNNKLAIAKQQELEETANIILQDENSPPLQKKRAYQVMEARGSNIVSKDNAHLWLAHLYREGDGTPKDPERAEYWQKRHDGLPEGATIKRSQP